MMSNEFAFYQNVFVMSSPHSVFVNGTKFVIGKYDICEILFATKKSLDNSVGNSSKEHPQNLLLALKD